MPKVFLIGLVALTTFINCGQVDFSRIVNKPNDPSVIKIDELMRESFYNTGALVTVVASPCKVGVAYELSYESGLNAIVQLEKESGNLKIINYRYNVQDPVKQQEYSQLCKSKDPEINLLLTTGKQADKAQKMGSSLTSLLPAASSLEKPRRQARIANGVKLSEKERFLYGEISILKDYPTDAQLVRVRSFQGYWVFDCLCDSSKDRILQYEVTLDKSGKFILRDQRIVLLKQATNQKPNIPKPTELVQDKEQKVTKQYKEYIQTQKIVQKKIEQKQKNIQTSSLTIDTQLEYVPVHPDDQESLIYVTSAIDALKFQLKEEADTIRLLQVSKALKPQDIIVIKLLCQSNKRKFEFLHESPKSTKIQKESVQVIEASNKDIKQKDSKDAAFRNFKYEVIPSQVLELPEFTIIVKRILKQNTDGQCRIESVDWCIEKRALRIKARKQKANQLFEFFSQLGEQDYQLIITAGKKKVQTKQDKRPQVFVINSQTPAEKQVKTVEKSYETTRLSKNLASNAAFLEKQKTFKTKIQTKQQYSLSAQQYEDIPPQILKATAFQRMLIKILQDNRLSNCRIKRVQWKKQGSQVIRIILISEQNQEKYLKVEVTEIEGVFIEAKNQKDIIRSQVRSNGNKADASNTGIEKSKTSPNNNYQTEESKYDENYYQQKSLKSEVSSKNNDKPTKVQGNQRFPASNSRAEKLVENKSQDRVVKQIPQKTIFGLPDYDLKKIPFSKKQPQYLSFLTAKLQRDFIKTPVFEQLMNYLCTEKKLSSSKLSIILMNKNKFGLRVVLQDLSDNKLYEAVMQFYQKESKYWFSIVSWKELHSLHAITVNPFSEYYTIGKSEQLADILTKAFGKSAAIDNIDSLESIQKRVASNGVYYKVVFNTKSSKQFQSEILFNPEINFANVIEYQEVNMPYDYSLEEDYVIPFNKDFVEVQDYLLKKYGQVFKNAQISYVRKSPSIEKTEKKDNFRIIFYSHSGRYEVILSYDYETRQVKILRMQQLDQGYKLQGHSDRHTLINPKVIEQSRQYLTKLFENIQARPYTQEKDKETIKQLFIELDEHKDYGVYYKIGYSNPLPIVFTIFEDKRGKDSSQFPILLSGVQSISTYSANKYYSPKLFKGFTEITPSELKYNKAFPDLQSKLKSKYSDVLFGEQQIMGVFSRFSNKKLSYKIVYKVQNKNIYIGSCEYNILQNRYDAISLEKTVQLTIEGTYSYGCEELSKDYDECLRCNKEFVLTRGRCYKLIQGCDAQIADACYFCRNGFVRNSDNLCYSNPERVISSQKTDQIKEKKLITEQKYTKDPNSMSKTPVTNVSTTTVNNANPPVTKVNKLTKESTPPVSTFDEASSTPIKSFREESLSSLTTSKIQPQRSSIIPIVGDTKSSLPPLPKLEQKNIKKETLTKQSSGELVYKKESQINDRKLRRDSSESATSSFEQGKSTLIRVDSQSKDSSGQSDPNCLQYNGNVCKTCIYRFYSKDGVCRKVPDPCSEYNRSTGSCTSCYTGYYLKNGDCLQRDRLCAETNSHGECVKCFSHYILLDGKCYYKLNGDIEPSNTNRDPLCSEYDSSKKCKKCVDGAYMNHKGVCMIADPNCEVLNEKYGFCEKCVRGYDQVDGKCLRRGNLK